MQVALVKADVVVNIIEVASGDPDGMVKLLTPDYQVVEDITAITPAPGVGWAYATTGYTAPAPMVPSAAEVAVQTAQGTVTTLYASIPAQVTQAKADATTIGGIAAGGTLTAAEITALTNHANGWVSILEALQALTVAARLVPGA